MKKTIPFLLLLVGAADAAHAQTGFKYGIKGGFDLSSYIGGGSFSSSTGFKPGFSAGVLVNYGITNNVSLQLEGVYAQKGVFIDQVVYNSTATPYYGYAYRATLSYIDVPLLVKGTFGEAGKGFFFELGPQFSFAMSDREFFRPQGDKVGSSNEITVYNSLDRMVPFEVGYVAGIGYQLTSGFGFDVRFSGDFTDVYKDGFGTGNGSLVGTNNFHNALFQLQAHYLFGGKKP